jgi:hypothetical protein
MRDIMIDIIKSLNWFPGFMLGSGLYLFFNIRIEVKRRNTIRKNIAIFGKSISTKKKNKVT